MIRAALLAVVALGACTSMSAPGRPVTGEWGGPHIGLVLDDAGGRIDYDCAAGTIEPVVPAPDGRFVAAGTHTPGMGGPDVQGQAVTTLRAQFGGRVRGNRMTLHGRVENGVVLGPFTLTRGAEAGILRCL